MSPLAQSKRTSTTPRGRSMAIVAVLTANFFAGCAHGRSEIRRSRVVPEEQIGIGEGGRGHLDDCIQGLRPHAEISRRERRLEDFSGCRRTQRNRGARRIAQVGHCVDGRRRRPQRRSSPKSTPCSRRRSPRSRTIRGLIAMAARCLHRPVRNSASVWGNCTRAWTWPPTSASPCMHRGRRRHLCRRRLARLRQRDHLRHDRKTSSLYAHNKRTQGENRAIT